MSSAHIATTIANDSPFCESRQNMKKLEGDLTSPEAMNAPLDEIERLLRTQGREMLRTMMQAHFVVTVTDIRVHLAPAANRS